MSGAASRDVDIYFCLALILSFYHNLKLHMTLPSVYKGILLFVLGCDLLWV